MAYKTKYQLMESSVVTDSNGDNYPDLATFPLNSLRITQKPSDYQLTNNDIFRFFDLMHTYYNDFDFYDYITLWLNNITDIANENNFGRNIKLYSKSDLDTWYQDNLKKE